MFEVLFRQYDPYPYATSVLHPADAAAVAQAEFRLLVHLDLGDQPAGRRIPPAELDPGPLSDDAAPSVAPDEVFRP